MVTPNWKKTFKKIIAGPVPPQINCVSFMLGWIVLKLPVLVPG